MIFNRRGVLSTAFPPRNSSPASFIRINGKIRAREVRVIGFRCKQLGDAPLNERSTSPGRLLWISSRLLPTPCRRVPRRGFRQVSVRTGQEGKGIKKHQHASTVRKCNSVRALIRMISESNRSRLISLRRHEGENHLALSRARDAAHPRNSGFEVVKKIHRRKNSNPMVTRFSSQTHWPRYQHDDEPFAAAHKRAKIWVVEEGGTSDTPSGRRLRRSGRKAVRRKV